ncbi:MAG: cysteine--tRNA ligase [Oscillospiraceae bacterium]|jgi:cysteinyl-tRNA synthetase|nr:cysteine--tRNA ligase [Oscillospiraceae bacterium]
MRIYNTLTRKKEEFVPQTPGKAGIYACGPTVYNFIHIGNARPLCVFDVLRRYLKWQGWNVTFVQNFTDIDDKLINKANAEGITAPEVAERFIAEYWTDARGLNVLDADIHPRATENIDGIIALIETLVDKGFAYESGGDVYFSPERFPGYGKLSHQSGDELEAGARISVGEQKRAPADFALWKSAKPGEPFWESTWGKGRPGWHIECSVMAMKHLGQTVDIHCGGQDLIFPHHENEIAQSECANGCDFAHYWMHNGYINVDNRKMSKSLNNFFTVREVASLYGYEPIRYLMISSHYRSPINYSADILAQSKNALARLYNCRETLEFLAVSGTEGENPELGTVLEGAKARFAECLDDDLNTADALAVLFDLARDLNTFAGGGKLTKNGASAALDVWGELCGVLGLLYRGKKDELEEEINELIEKRQTARKTKDFAEADRIRDVLKARGILLEDTPQGVKWKRVTDVGEVI